MANWGELASQGFSSGLQNAQDVNLRRQQMQQQNQQFQQRQAFEQWQAQQSPQALAMAEIYKSYYGDKDNGMGNGSNNTNDPYSIAAKNLFSNIDHTKIPGYNSDMVKTGKMRLIFDTETNSLKWK